MDRLDCVFLLLVIIAITLLAHALDPPLCEPDRAPRMLEPLYHTI